MKKKPSNEISKMEKFIETARSLGCDESEATFDAKLRKIVTAKPTTNAELKKGGKKKKPK